MKIAIIGSRNFKDKIKVWAELDKLFYNSYTHAEIEINIISGGAPGVDTWGVEWARALSKSIPIEVIRPINPADRFSYLLRNVEIITKADKIIAFWDGQSRGTRFVIDYAQKRKMEIIIICQVAEDTRELTAFQSKA